MFGKNKPRKDGLHYYCKPCNAIMCNPASKKRNQNPLRRQQCVIATRQWWANNPWKANAISAKKRASKLQATPPWFEKEKVAIVYQKAKEWGFEVDHVIPLKGKNVSGLHCWANLQLLDKSLNSSKGNKV